MLQSSLQRSTLRVQRPCLLLDVLNSLAASAVATALDLAVELLSVKGSPSGTSLMVNLKGSETHKLLAGTRSWRRPPAPSASRATRVAMWQRSPWRILRRWSQTASSLRPAVRRFASRVSMPTST